MRFRSTRDPSAAATVSFREAVMRGMAPDGGLYIPETIPRYPDPSRLASSSFAEIAFEAARFFACPDLGEAELLELIADAYDFPVPLVELEPGRHALELFRGPTAAFKDFGARFMARVMGIFVRGESRPLLILTATSGDTGGAVADGFHGVAGIDVVVLYPKGRVSPIQERQIAGLGGNIHAVAIEGSFDDCQTLVKRACSDPAAAERRMVSSANSINVARLVPQTFYYLYAAGRIDPDGTRVLVASVPSGNYGNLTAGLWAQAMGAPIARFVAATNANRAVPDYLESGLWRPRPSIATISNAMDVGNPSNFERMTSLLPYPEMAAAVTGFPVTDEETIATIVEVDRRFGYVLDPHGAVAWTALGRALAAPGSGAAGFACLTAHPAKFREIVESAIGRTLALPPELSAAESRNVSPTCMPPEYGAFLSWLRDEIR
ncbi:MAG: threonine synthase [Spirochaetes bacterium]|nr:threonine synthase [Spirochaetota bacterium]